MCSASGAGSTGPERRARGRRGYLRPPREWHSIPARRFSLLPSAPKPTVTQLLSVLLVLSTAPSGETPQWSGFRGNNGCGVSNGGVSNGGVSSGAGLPSPLDPEANLQWRVEVPAGYSSPVIAGKNLYLTGAMATAAGRILKGKLVTLCLDTFSGETRWRRELDFTGARPGQSSAAAPKPPRPPARPPLPLRGETSFSVGRRSRS